MKSRLLEIDKGLAFVFLPSFSGASECCQIQATTVSPNITNGRADI